MRTFNFKARNIGNERYLTYTMGEDCELDEDVLDYCEENALKELVGIIYEEDDDYDYLTYDITDRVSLEEYIKSEMTCEKVLNILRNVADGLISLKEQAIHLSYVLLNKGFMFVDESDYSISFICLPVESKAAVASEFKSFVRQLLANMRYDVDENLSYVGKLLTYINSDNFNLRGLVGLSEALMDEAGINHDEAGTIESDGVEVVSAVEPEEDATTEESNVADFMTAIDEQDEKLPEIGDDAEEEDEESEDDVNPVDEELDSILPSDMTPEAVDTDGDKSAEPKRKETDVDVIKDRIKKLVGDKTDTPPASHTITSLDELDQILDSKPPVIKKNVVKVNRAAIIQNVAAEHESEEAATEESDEKTQIPVIEDIYDDMNIEKDEAEEKPKSRSILSRTVGDAAAKQNTLLNAPKAVPYLIRVNTEERIMLNKPTFKLGKASRGVDYSVSGNGAVSRQHAVILQKDGVCFIKDNKSTNHTYVNGKMVEDGVEEILTHDSVIKLGDEEFIFKIR